MLAALGQLLFTGANPLYLIAPLARAALLIVAASSGRRFGLIAVVSLEGLSLAGFWLSGLVGLLTNLALPAVMLWLALRLLTAPRLPVVPHR